MIAAEIHNGHVYHHQLQSRRVKLRTGNAISMQLCLLLLFDQVKNTQKLKRYEPKCPTKNQSTLPLPFICCVYSITVHGRPAICTLIGWFKSSCLFISLSGFCVFCPIFFGAISSSWKYFLSLSFSF